jgi:hypothetical protein
VNDPTVAPASALVTWVGAQYDSIVDFQVDGRHQLVTRVDFQFGCGRLRLAAAGCVQVGACCELVADVDLEVDARYELVAAVDLEVGARLQLEQGGASQLQPATAGSSRLRPAVAGCGLPAVADIVVISYDGDQHVVIHSPTAATLEGFNQCIKFMFTREHTPRRTCSTSQTTLRVGATATRTCASCT